VDIDEVLRSQDGVISRRQALAAGLSPTTITTRVTGGQWRAVYPGVYLTRQRDLTDEARPRAAVLWCGPEAAAAGVAAAWWHGLWPACPPDVDITVPRRQAVARRLGVRIRPRDLDVHDRVTLHGLAVTGLALTVLEGAVALGDDGPQLLDRALQRRTHLGALREAHRRNLGRHGSAAAARLLIAAADRADSQAERLMIELLRESGLGGWRQGYLVDGYQVDFAFVEWKLAIEVDGWAFHSDPIRFRRDRHRQNDLVLRGWTVLRFTWHDLTHRPAVVINDIRTALMIAV
jgi:very-short-patch-repair endonuclease